VEYKYDNGCRVITKGFLRVTFSEELKIILWEFEAKCHEEYLPTSIFREKRLKRPRGTSLNINVPQDNTPCTPSGGEISLDSLPKSHVNQFGLPPPVMRCFEITEVIHYMKDLIDFAMERQLAPLESLELYHKEIIDKPSQGVPQTEPDYNGWTGPNKHVHRVLSKQASFLQPPDDCYIRDDIDPMSIFDEENKLIKTEKNDSNSPLKKPTSEEMDLNSIPAEPSEEKFDPNVLQIEIKEEKSFSGNAKIKEEKSEKDREEKSGIIAENEKASEKEEEERIDEEEEDPDKPESKSSKKRIKKPRVAIQNISMPPNLQRSKRNKKK